MLGGTFVSKETALKRVSVCYTRNVDIIDGKEFRKPCEFMGVVNPLPLVHDCGCTICGCPFKTKPLMETYVTDALEIEKVTCPHPQGDMWAEL